VELQFSAVSKGSVLELVEEETEGEIANPCLPAKTAVKTEEECCPT